jgi:hypothetical protein
MKSPILVIMAAGLGSRFGSLKQIAPVDDDGHISCQRSDGVIVEGKFFLLLTLAFCRILVVHFVTIIQLHFHPCYPSYDKASFILLCSLKGYTAIQNQF